MDQPTGLRASQLREFIRSWEDAYCFTQGQGMYHAQRRDHGAVLHVGTLEDLYGQVTQDYLAKPVRTARS